jgi:hypothetical protein
MLLRATATSESEPLAAAAWRLECAPTEQRQQERAAAGAFRRRTASGPRTGTGRRCIQKARRQCQCGRSFKFHLRISLFCRRLRRVGVYGHWVAAVKGFSYGFLNR